MNNMKKVFVIILALAFGGLFLPGCVYVRNLSGWSTTRGRDFKFNIGIPASYEEKGYEVFDVDENGVLSINADNIKLNIEGSQVSQIQVDYAKQVWGKNITPDEAQRVMDEMSINFKQQDDAVYISASTSKKFNVGINIPKCLSLDIKIPVETEIVINSNNGAVKIQNVAGDIYIKSDNAVTTLTDVGGDVKINNDNGAIRLTSTSIGNLLLESDNGAINVLLGKLTGDSYTIETDNGMVNIVLSQKIAADLEISVKNGMVRSDFLLDQKDHTYTGSIGGGGPKIKVSTDNGMVSIKKDK